MGCIAVRVKVDDVDSYFVHSDRRAALGAENKSAPTLMRSERESRWKSLMRASAQSLSRLAETTHTHATTHGCDLGASHELERNDTTTVVNGGSYESCACGVTIWRRVLLMAAKRPEDLLSAPFRTS